MDFRKFLLPSSNRFFFLYQEERKRDIHIYLSLCTLCLVQCVVSYDNDILLVTSIMAPMSWQMVEL